MRNRAQKQIWGNTDFLKWEIYVLGGSIPHHLSIMLFAPMVSEMPWEIFPKLWSSRTSLSSSSSSSSLKDTASVKQGLDSPALSSHCFCSPYDLRSDKMTLRRATSKVNNKPPFSLLSARALSQAGNCLQQSDSCCRSGKGDGQETRQIMQQPFN